jgi:hypothetical protein
MAFIAQTNTKTLYAYLTPKGRQYILDGDKEDFQIAYFSLHDDDVNYQISSNISAGTTYYTLQSGFIPDITGDNDNCIKSIAKGTTVNMQSTLFATDNTNSVGKIGSNGDINQRNLTFGIANLNLGLLENVGSNTNIDFNFTVNLTAPNESDSEASATLNQTTAPITPAERLNSKFYIIISNPTSQIKDIKINNKATSLDSENLISFTGGSNSITLNNSFKFISLLPQGQQTNLSFDIIIIPLNSSNKINYLSAEVNNNIIIRYTRAFTAPPPVDPGGGDGGNTSPVQ